MKPTFFSSAAEFRAWLEAHHSRERELLVGFYKRAGSPKGSRSSGDGARSKRNETRGFSRATLTYQEALDEALAFGWIDGVRRRHDDRRWTIRFTPRRARSIWSNVNIRRMKELIADRRVTPAGLRAFEAREERRSGVYTYERTPTTFDAAAEEAFAANRQAKTFFDVQPPGYRRLMTGWVMQAKKEETRLKRLARLIDQSSRGRRLDLMNPYK